MANLHLSNRASFLANKRSCALAKISLHQQAPWPTPCPPFPFSDFMFEHERLSRDRLHLGQSSSPAGQARPCSPAAHYRRSPIRLAQWHYPHQLSSIETTSTPTAMSLLEKRWCTVLDWCFSRLRKCRFETGKPKSVRGDRLGFQRTLVDLILNAQATRVYLMRVEMTKDELIKLAPLPGIQFISHFVEPGQMENSDRTLKELATPDVVYQPWCIQYPQLEPAQTYELKSGLIHLLPKFHGLTGEDPHKHLKEFHVGILEDYIKMKAFPFSLDRAAKD
ncbi:hypothetical protein CR513_22181, partial [Mucuna pruriens]